MVKFNSNGLLINKRSFTSFSNLTGRKIRLPCFVVSGGSRTVRGVHQKFLAPMIEAETMRPEPRRMRERDAVTMFMSWGLRKGLLCLCQMPKHFQRAMCRIMKRHACEHSQALGI